MRKPLLSFLFLFVFQLHAQDESGLLTLDRIFASREFYPQSFGQSRWLDDGSSYTTLEKSVAPQGGRDIVQYDSRTGKRSVLVSAEKLVPAGNTQPLEIDDYQWSTDKTQLLIFTNTKRVWRYNTRGDYWVLDLKSGSLKQLGKELAESSLMFAKFSPDGKKAAYVSKHDLYVENLSDGMLTRLTSDGSETMINGTFDWVYEEELDCRDGFRWSPDSKRIAYWKLDASGIRNFYMINNTDSVYSRLIPVQYPKVGEWNSVTRVGVISAEGGATTFLKLEGDPRDNYPARMEWAESSDELAIQYLNRAQNQNQIILANATTGDIKVIETEKDEAYLDAVDDWQWLDNGKKLLWISERDGWRNVYSVSRDGKEVKRLTPFNFDVISLLRVDVKNGWLYYIASPKDPIRRYLYRSKLNGTGKEERLTPMDLQGWNDYDVSPDGKWAIHTYSTTEKPPTVSFVELPKHKNLRTLVENSGLEKKFAVLKKKPTEFFKVDIGGGLLIDGMMLKPPDFDPAKKYPVIFHVYGEPASHLVRDSWRVSNKMWHLMLAQQGYIVILIDNRGTPLPRGRDFRKAIYKKIGVINSGDQAAANRVIRTWSFVDSTRIGVWGWSGGGAMTLNCMFRYPELYQTGVAVASVTDQRNYDNIYTERYMGLLRDGDEHYVESSPITYAKNLRGNLLIIHGTGDDNVHYANQDMLINELIKQNKKFSMMAYPNRTHGIYEGKGTTLHLYGLMTDYWLKNLPPGGR
ncbi:MAG: S9 family peptidase [Bacteroidetes bacterium]|nr:S9 family peptidase [Bacteroidota bacterium]